MKIYQTIRDTGGWENWEMVPLEEFPCESNVQARIREQYWINQLNPTMNCLKAYRTEEEKTLQKKAYNFNHKDTFNKIRVERYNTDALYREKTLSKKREKWERVKSEMNKQMVTKYNTDSLYRYKKLVSSHNTYEKIKEEFLPKKREEYQKNKDELNKIRREEYQKNKNTKNAYRRWVAWKKTPYESVLNESFMQKLLK